MERGLATFETLASFLDGKARLLRIDPQTDERGSLLAFDYDRLPFTPQRLFCIYDAPQDAVRGRHGHTTGSQLLACLAGRIEVVLKIGVKEEQVELLPGGGALQIDAPVWSRHRYIVPKSVLLVLASEPFANTVFIGRVPDAPTA